MINTILTPHHPLIGKQSKKHYHHHQSKQINLISTHNQPKITTPTLACCGAIPSTVSKGPEFSLSLSTHRHFQGFLWRLETLFQAQRFGLHHKLFSKKVFNSGQFDKSLCYWNIQIYSRDGPIYCWNMKLYHYQLSQLHWDVIKHCSFCSRTEHSKSFYLIYF